MEASISSHPSTLPLPAASDVPRRRRTSPAQLRRAAAGRRVLIGDVGQRHPVAAAVVMCFGGRKRRPGGRDFGGELVDENMAVLRKRIHEVRMTEEGRGGPPEHWAEWEKRHHGCYTAAVSDTVATLQHLLLSTRPSVALGVAALLAMSVPTSAMVVVLSLVGGH